MKTSVLWMLSIWIVCVASSCGPSVPAPIEPAPPNDFLSGFSAYRLDNTNGASPIGDEVEIETNSGVMAQFCLEAQTTLPIVVGDRAVVPKEDWNMMVTVYPRGSDPKSAESFFHPVNPMVKTTPMTRGAMPRSNRNTVTVGSAALWSSCGFQLADIPKKIVFDTAHPVPREALWYWTYICGPKDGSGDYVYEIRLLPTARMISPFRAEIGEPVVLKRGLLRVRPVAS